MSRVFTKEHETFLKNIAYGRSVQECTDMLNLYFNTNFNVSQVRNFKTRKHISSGKKPHEFVDRSKRRIFNDVELEFIVRNVKGISNRQLADMFNKEFNRNVTPDQIYRAKHKCGVVSGLTGRFEKGNIPQNKGKKMSEKQYEKCKKTMFASGHKPKNTYPIGTEKRFSDGYIWVKIDDKPNAPKKVNWIQKHKMLWQLKNGPVPDNHVLIFKDGNPENICLENLDCIPKSVLLIINKRQLVTEDSNVSESGIALARLIDTINKKNKEI